MNITRFGMFFLWLGGISYETLSICSEAEKNKYIALGASVLIPSTLGIISSYFALDTLISHGYINFLFAFMWGGFILIIDRLLLSSYRIDLSGKKNKAQFGIRFFIALLIGMTVTHPLVINIFSISIENKFFEDKLKRIK